MRVGFPRALTCWGYVRLVWKAAGVWSPAGSAEAVHGACYALRCPAHCPPPLPQRPNTQLSDIRLNGQRSIGTTRPPLTRSAHRPAALTVHSAATNHVTVRPPQPPPCTHVSGTRQCTRQRTPVHGGT